MKFFRIMVAIPSYNGVDTTPEKTLEGTIEREYEDSLGTCGFRLDNIVDDLSSIQDRLQWRWGTYKWTLYPTPNGKGWWLKLPFVHSTYHHGQVIDDDDDNHEAPDDENIVIPIISISIIRSSFGDSLSWKAARGRHAPLRNVRWRQLSTWRRQYKVGILIFDP